MKLGGTLNDISHDIPGQVALMRLALGTAPSSIADGPAPHGKSEVERIDYLDGWRGLAIAFVLQGHFMAISEVLSDRLGVDIFFSLSGMLMSHILFERRVPLTRFYKRRISRIVPVFVLYVLIVYGTAWLASQSFEATEILATLFFLRTYVPAEPGIWNSNLPIGHLWSLNVEEHCYVLLSIVTIFVAGTRRTAIVLLMLAFAAIAIQIGYHRGLLPPVRDDEIRTETAAAYILMSAGYALVRHRFSPWVRPWMPCLAFLATIPWYWRGMHGGLSELLTPVLLAFVVNHLNEAGASVRRALAVAPLRLLGLWSYSIYLWQQPLYQFRELMPPGLAFGSAFAAGVVSFYFFENPVRTWLNRNW